MNKLHLFSAILTISLVINLIFSVYFGNIYLRNNNDFEIIEIYSSIPSDEQAFKCDSLTNICTFKSDRYGQAYRVPRANNSSEAKSSLKLISFHYNINGLYLYISTYKENNLISNKYVSPLYHYFRIVNNGDESVNKIYINYVNGGKLDEYVEVKQTN